MLVQTDVLTIRPLPSKAAVYIPAEELAERVYELPPRTQVLKIVGDALPDRPSISIGADEVAEGRVGERYRLWHPNELLAELAPRLTPGRALDLGCGTGRDAVFLADLGWEVTAVDNLPEALDRGRNLQSRYAPDGKPISFVNADLRDYEASEAYDLITFFFFFDRKLLQRIRERLVPGGLLAVEFFTEEHRQKHGKPANALGKGELLSLIDGLEVIDYDEAWHGTRHTARLLARSA